MTVAETTPAGAAAVRRRASATKADNIRFAKLVVFINALVPGAMLAWDWANHQVGPDPVALTIHTTGMLTLIFLALTLLVTPLKKITGFAWLFHFRRMLGLYAFFYGVAHFLSFFGLQENFHISWTIHEMIARPFLIIGSLGLLLMVPLAATSFNWAIKQMGSRNWQALHRLVYVTAAAGAVHFYQSTKADKRLPLVFIGIFAVLLGYRVVVWAGGMKKRVRRAA
ncbi:MAG TPA: protein-methionine-sulfoxide reductase heme-binding subunit MsrQ [Phycisphaerae bacterium]|nr:protein-methionine-sulfoxide reductase heme-binding subunit MsrQ [Phycisphaerae bacterium]